MPKRKGTNTRRRKAKQEVNKFFADMATGDGLVDVKKEQESDDDGSEVAADPYEALVVKEEKRKKGMKAMWLLRIRMEALL